MNVVISFYSYSNMASRRAQGTFYYLCVSSYGLQLLQRGLKACSGNILLSLCLILWFTVASTWSEGVLREHFIIFVSHLMVYSCFNMVSRRARGTFYYFCVSS
jgi:hypothetical protein